MLAYSLKEGKPGDEFKVSDLVRMTSINHVTISYYLELINHVQNNLPRMEYVEKKRNSYVRILKEVEFPMSEEEHTLLSLFDKGAFNKLTAVSFNENSRGIMEKMKGSSLIAEISEKVYLLPDGIVAGAELAGKRADLVLFNRNKEAIVKGEIMIENGAEGIAVSEGSIVMTEKAAAFLFEQLNELMDKRKMMEKQTEVSD